MDRQIRDISKKRKWKRILKRSVALLCAVVMLFTMNTLKRNADTLERIAMCGYAEHVHSASCFSGDALVCGMEEHIHTDACYQTRPSGDVEVLTIDSDEDIPVEDADVELGDLVLDVDVGDLVLDEPGALTVNESAPTEAEKYFILGESAKVSTIIKELELGIKRKQIEAVGAIENDEEHIGLIRVDALEKDWLVSAAKDFDEAELAIVLADDIVVVKLKDGRVPEDLDTPVEEQIDIEAPAVDEQIEQSKQPVVDEQEPVIEEQPIEVKQIEVPSVEESEQPAEVQAQPAEDEMPVEETVPAEETSPEEEQTTEEAPPAEEQLTEESAPVEGEQSDEESAPVEEQPAEAELSTDDEQQPAEDAEVTAEETAPAEGAEALAELPTDDEQSGYEQPVVPVEEQGEEGALTEEQGEVDEGAVPAEEQGEDGQQPEVVAPVDEEQGEDDAPAEEHGESAEKSEEDMQPEGTVSVDEEQGEEGIQSEEVALTDEQGEDARQPEEAAPVGEEQSEDAVPAEENEETTPAEEQGEDAQQAEEVAPVEEEQGEDAQQAEETAPVDEEQGEDAQQAEETAPVDEEQTEDAAPGEDYEEATSAEEEGEEDDQSEVATPADEQGEDAEQSEEAEAEEGQSEEQGEQQPDEQGEDAEQSEEAEAGEGQSEEQGEQLPDEQDGDAEQLEEGEAEEGQLEEQSGQQPDEQGEDAEQSEEAEAEEGQPEEQGEQQPEAQTYTATIDLTDVETYPLSLNAMLTAATPEQEEIEEETIDEEAQEDQAEEQPTLTIDYDEALLEVVGQDGDYLVTPIQSFESTQIIVNNGSRYELTLVNCALATDEQPEDEGEQQEEARDVPVYTATIDLTDATYPLSLNEMITAATPEQGDYEEAQEDQAEEQPEEQPTLTIDYDEALLEVVEQDGDYLVRPVQSFESTQIIVTNGSRYELTLVNCVLKAEEQEEQSAPVHTATIDLTNATYPLSLNELITGVAPEQAESEQPEKQPEIEQSEAQNEQQVEEQPTLTIDYDEALLSIVEAEGDHLITPVQSFESTQIMVDNGSAYALTLMNCALPEDEAPAEQPEAARPAQDFEGHTAHMKVVVSAPEGAFPEGTKMTVADVEDEKTLSDIQDTVTEGFVEVERVHAVDITFTDALGNEIEPLLPISVVMTVEEIGLEETAVVVHVDDEGAAQVVESQSEAPVGETGLKVEMPAAETSEAAEPQASEGADESAEPQANAEGASVGFEADSFSVYAVVVTRTIETKYIDAEGDTWNISVRYGAEAEIPDTATLAVSEVTDERYLADAEAALEGGKRVTLARFFDIKIMNGETEVQPKQPVEVSVALDNTEIAAIEPQAHVIDNGESGVCAVHFDGENADIVTAAETEAAVVFDAEGFSVWGVVFTVDFYYGDYEYHLPGEGYITLPGLFDVLEIEADAAQATDVAFTNPELVAVRRVEADTPVSAILAEYGGMSVNGDAEGEEQPEEEGEDEIIPAGTWLLVSLAPFDTEEKLTVTMEDGTVYEIRVEDDATDYTVLVNDRNGGYIGTTGGVNAFQEYSSGGYMYVQDVEKDWEGHVQFFRHKAGQRAGSLNAVAKSGYDFVFWLVVKSDGTMLTINGATLTTDKMTETNALYIPCFAPTGAKLIIRGEPEPRSSSAWHYTPRDVVRYVYYTSQHNDVPRYNYSTDNGGTIEWQTSFDDAWRREQYNFLGWFNQNRYISKGYDINDNGVIKHNFKLSDVTEHTILIPKYELKPEYRNYLNVWFDGTNGVYGGEAPNNTFYTRIESTGKVRGSTSVLQQVNKSNGNSGSATFTLPTTAVAPQSQGDNHFELQGWYDIYNKRWYAKGATVTITSDSVFYADWMPTNYNASSASSVSSLNTNNFITTRMFDYNNLFNMDCIELDSDRTYVNMFANSERWKMKGTADDFIFITKVAGAGKSVMPDGRTSNNTNNETTTNGTYYSGQVSSGLLNDSLRSRLFGTSDGLGKRYLGTANYLYQYDNSTGYYYYDSDKNAASYDKGGQRFYVYSYRNATDKSNGLDGDFLPYNYGSSTFTEAYGAPNYWFGMSSQIDFFLPNAAGYTDNQGVTGNRSIKGDEMVYKFAGDDDVWVFVDGQLVLDMGGVHGKVYGEINFSQGTWAVVSNGASKVNDAKDIMSYVEGTGTIQTGTLNLAEGDHTLTLYYLERGSSQSNCAIYFNIAPKYSLRLEKMDAANKSTKLGGARFGIYTDEACTVAADLYEYYNTNNKTNEFVTSSDGLKHLGGLVAGRTYYIKELQAPENYPDMSGHVIKLWLDARGKECFVTLPTSAKGMVDTTGMTHVEGDTYKLNWVSGTPGMIYLPVLNDKKTSISATKTWSLLDGKEYRTFEMNGQQITEYENANASSTVKLHRYIEDTNGELVGNHTVQLVTQYFAAGGKPSRQDGGSLVHYQTESRVVGDGEGISFNLSTGTGAGIYSVVASAGSLTSNASNYTTDKPFKVNGSYANLPTQGSYRITGLYSDAVIYLTFIGEAETEAELAGKIHIENVTVTDNSGTARRIHKDEGFDSDPRDSSGTPISTTVTLNKAKNWTHTWDNLASADGSGKRYYYYVTEESAQTEESTAVSAALGGASAFIKTTSSDGLSGGIITVHNTLRAVKVKLRKRDAEYANGNRVDLKGAEFAIYTDAEYQKYKNNQGASAMAPNDGLINSGEMGQYVGTKLVTDDLGRFYTGFLPNGEYYIVETKAPDGYVPLEHDIKIRISETGLAYDLNGGDNFVTRKADSEGIYNLFIDNTMDVGSIRLQKQWKTGSDYGLVREYENDYQANSFGLDEDNKLYSSSDNGAKAVLLSLGCVVNGAVDANAVSDVYANPTSYGLSADQIVNYNGTKYIKLAKTGAEWPTLTVSNLPLKRYADVSYTDRGQTMTHIAPVDGWYFIEEYGYIDASDRVVRVENKTNDWTVSYGYVNGATNGSGKTENVAGTDRNLILAKKNDPDTLTVTNGFKGGLTFTKKQTGTEITVPGATFQIIPDGAGVENYMTGADTMLTSDSNGVVSIAGLPVGTYWMWEKEAPAGYRKTDNMYCLVIAYPQSYMYLYEGGKYESTNVVENPPVGALKLTKTVKVNGSTPATDDTHTNGTYEFNIDGLGSTPTDGIHRTVKITFAGGVATSWQIDDGVEQPVANGNNSWSVIVPDLTPGQYTVTEIPPTNDTVLWEASGGTMVDEEKKIFVTVVARDVAAAETSARASFTNSYNRVDVKIVKIDETTHRATNQIKLSEAQFTLAVGTADTNGRINYSNYWYDSEHEAIETTDDRGELAFENLPDGYYRIQETGVPKGYIRTSDPYIYFTVFGGVLTWTDENQERIADPSTEVNLVTYSQDDNTFTVGNNPGAALPNTGGTGTTLYYVSGAALLLLALALLLRKRSEN